jgi:hypothetical protein
LFLFTTKVQAGRTVFAFLAKVVSMSSTHSSNDLEQGLKPRHVTMLSIAGVIGAGLFVGSGHAIAAAGPAVLLAYAAAGTLVVLVMRMLAKWPSPRRTPVRSPPTPTAPSAMGRLSPSAGCTGGSGCW